MQGDDLIDAEKFCLTHNIQRSFIAALEEFDLIEITTIEEMRFISDSQLPRLEQIMRLHFELDINLEGVEAITHLLERVSLMQDEITYLKNRLRTYES